MSEVPVIELDEPVLEATMASVASIFQIRVDDDDVIIQTMASNQLSEGFIEVSQETHDEASREMLRHGARFRNGVVEPMPAPPPPPITLSAETLFFDRMTPDEYDDLDASIAAKERASISRGWRNANSFTEGTDMWALLVKHLALVVSTERTAELLARP